MTIAQWTMRGGALAAAVLLAVPLSAQTVTLDEGTFRILVDGNEVGVERFVIKQNGTGANAVVQASGQVVLEAAAGGGQTVSVVELAGAGLRPTRYELELRGPDARRIQGTVVGARASARTTSPAGEALREYIVGNNAVLIDDGVAHHYYFLARRLEDGSAQVPILIPRENRQVMASVTTAGQENVTIGSTAVPARRLVVRPAGGDERSVWVDAEGRVLQVRIPARNYTAVRSALP